MSKILKSDLKRGLFSFNFVLAVLIIFSSVFIEWYLKFRMLDATLDYIFPRCFGDSYIFTFPIAALLPFYGIYNEDKRSGYIKFVVMRTSANKYIFSKIISSAICSFLAIFCGICLFGILFSLYSNATVNTHFAVENLNEKILSYGGFPLYVISAAFFAGLIGVAWNLCGMFFSSIINDKFLCFAITFAAYFMNDYIGVMAWFNLDFESAQLVNHFCPTYMTFPFIFENTYLYYKLILFTAFAVMFIPLFHFFVRRKGIYDN